jgi:ParB-like chromosome segregation protein Spo0J
MSAHASRIRVKEKFGRDRLRLPLDLLIPLKIVGPAALKTKKYQQIVASVATLGLVEPLVVFPAPDGRHYLVDGHLRVEALKTLGEAEADCIVSTDDDTYSYNKQVNRIGAVQDHRMIVEAISRGVSEERISQALGLSKMSVKRRRKLLNGIDSEVAEKLAQHHSTAIIFRSLRKMHPQRQREAAELMIGQGNFSSTFAEALVAASKPYQLVGPSRKPMYHAATVRAIAGMEQELAKLQENVKSVEGTFGEDLLQLTVIKGYIAALLNRARVVKWLARNRPEHLREFQKIAEVAPTEA